MNARGTGSATGTLDRTGQAIQRRAAEWLALREAQGFSLTQQADFAEWLAENPRHAAVFAEVESAWRRFDRLASYPHSVDTAPNPDLLAGPPARIRVRPRWAPVALAAAAAIAVAWFSRAPAVDPVIALADNAAAAPRFLRLSDGSTVELNGGSVVTEHFTPAERRLRLVRGEAHFSVTKDPAREFIVEADGVAVRALGTAFNVRLQGERVEVLVTEGKVRVAPPAGRLPPASASPRTTSSLAPAAISATLSAGQRTIVPAAAGAADSAPVIETLAPAEIGRALAWQTSRLSFDAIPLADVVQRLNRFPAGQKGAAHLVIRDPELGARLISGRLGSNDIESFVEALEASFGVVADRQPDGAIVLRSARR